MTRLDWLYCMNALRETSTESQAGGWASLVFVFSCVFVFVCVFCKTLIRVVVLYDREGETSGKPGRVLVAAMPAAPQWLLVAGSQQLISCF